jgi:hypothetical protein
MPGDNASLDGNGGMWIINGVIALLSFVGLLLGESQVFMLLQKDNTEQW